MNQISRRQFTKILGSGAAYAAFTPSMVVTNPSIRWRKDTAKASSIVRLSSNENPRGPSPRALKAMTDAYSLAWRYPDEHADILAEKLAKLHDVSTDQIVLGNGSGEILKLAAAAFTDNQRKAVVADPTFEALARHATTARAEVVKVSLTTDYRHDLSGMLAAAQGAGLIYICNPNNPTASLTPKNEIKKFLTELPRQTRVLIDEAYHHYVESNDYESAMPLVKHHPNLIVARTFSKVYGMAGLRCGYCVTQAENIQAMRRHQLWDNVNIMALVAATASLDDTRHVEQGRSSNTDAKQYVYAELDRLRYRYIPSHANFLMIDIGRDVRPVIDSLSKRNVQVGRFFPSLPNLMRVTVGTRPQMETFLTEFRGVMTS
jgi:histidinol-phosphate aminotransferase